MSRKVFLASFSNDHDVLRAVQDIRRAGYTVLDVHCPYPVHGLDEAMGLAPSKLPVVCFLLGTGGALFAFLFQTWVSTVDWPVRIGGKPFYAWPSFIPIAFELTVLCAGIGTVAALLLTRGLFPWKGDSPALPRVTDDRFTVVVDRGAAGFDPAHLDALCSRRGAVECDGRAEAAS